MKWNVELSTAELIVICSFVLALAIVMAIVITCLPYKKLRVLCKALLGWKRGNSS